MVRARQAGEAGGTGQHILLAACGGGPDPRRGRVCGVWHGLRSGRSAKTIKKNENVLAPILATIGARRLRELTAGDVHQALTTMALRYSSAAVFARMTSSWSSVGSGIIRVSEQNTQPKSHRLVTWTITDSGASAASASARGSRSPTGEK